MKHALIVSLLVGCTGGYSSSGSYRGTSAPPPQQPAVFEAPPPEAPPPGSSAAAMPASPPGRWTLEEKEYWIKLHEELDAYAEQANDACGARITATFVHESFRGRLDSDKHFGLSLDTRALCGAMAHSLVEVCNGSATAKRAVASQIRELVCEYGPQRYAIDEGVFHASINTEQRTLDTNYNTMLAVIRKSL